MWWKRFFGGGSEPSQPFAETQLGPLREFHQQGYRVRVDARTQVLRLDIPDNDGVGFSMEEPAEAPIYPTLAEMEMDGFVSASMLAQKAKQFDDGLYAAVELAARDGAGDFAGKSGLIRETAAHLGTLDPGAAASVFLAAAKLGGLGLEPPAPHESGVEKALSDFEADALRSKPLGFYTWSDDLKAIFRQDKMLQSKLDDPAGVQALASFLASNATHRRTYENYLGFVERLTNPYPPEMSDLRSRLDASASPMSRGEEPIFFPPSQSHETEFLKKLGYLDKPLPDGFDLMREFIAAIRKGKVELTPRENSGWYDYQTFALETLAAPDRADERERLELTSAYRKHLEDLFKGILALTRETHVKQLEMLCAGAGFDSTPKIRVQPVLDVEPLATYYRRRADSYRFIREALAGFFGAGALDKMRRLTREGPVKTSLARELADIEGLFWGAYSVSADQIGLTPDIEASAGGLGSADANRDFFQNWRQNLKSDADLSRDARMMVPVFYDIGRRKTKVWVFLGWADRPLQASFAQRPTVEVLDGAGQAVSGKSYRLEFGSLERPMAYPVMAEVYVSRLLDRDEFRRHCDLNQTRTKILENLA
jgi:hypothetical protein